MSRSSLPPGFRFHPTDIELVSYYLKRKVMGKPFGFEAISEVELYKYAPWDLPDKSCLKSKDLEWYFFCPRDRKYANGSRTNRATDIGYWKTTGKDRHIIYKSQTVGMKRTLVFHIGKAPRGDRTDWVMHEYRLENNDWGNAPFSQDAYVICKIFEKSGPGPKNGEQHGAPFNEEDWDDDKAFENAFSIPLLTSNPLVNQSLALVPAHQPEASEIGVVSSTPNFMETDGIFLDQLEEILNSSPLHSGNPNDEAICAVDMEGIYDELEDLCCQTVPEPTDVIHLSDDISNHNALESMISELSCDHYMELNDLSFIDESDPLAVLDDPFPPYLIGNTDFFEDISAAAIGSVWSNHMPSCPDVFNNHSHLIAEMDASEGMHVSDALSDLLGLGGG